MSAVLRHAPTCAVQSGTCHAVPLCALPYSGLRRMTPIVSRMVLRQQTGALAATWILAAGLIGFIGQITSIGGAAVVLGVGLVPPILMMLHRNMPVLARLRQRHG